MKVLKAKLYKRGGIYKWRCPNCYATFEVSSDIYENGEGIEQCAYCGEKYKVKIEKTKEVV